MPEPVGGEAKSAVLSSQQEIEELEQDRQRISLLDIVRNNLQKKGKVKNTTDTCNLFDI